MRYLLDTSALLAHHRQESGWETVQGLFETPRRLPLVDALIAAVAQVRSAVLVHRDEHMRAIPGDQLQQNDLNTPANQP